MNTANIKEAKQVLRDRYRRERREKFVQSSFTFLLTAPEVVAARCVTSYISTDDEPSTTELNRELLARGVTLLLPRVAGKVLLWIEWNGDTSLLKESKKLFEPIGQERTDISDIDVVIVPGLHLDQQGYRLGQGGGFYDRALPKLPGWKVGLVHSGEISEERLPREDHDMKLDAAATPDLIIRFPE